jgi:hypothetical protein
LQAFALLLSLEANPSGPGYPRVAYGDEEFYFTTGDRDAFSVGHMFAGSSRGGGVGGGDCEI